ncbi:nibrin [Trichonephila clavipes]|nr:nibrin [Trichonephila clavipes]
MPNEDRYIYLAVTAKRNRRSTALDLSHQLSSATSTTVLRQTVYRRIGHIGLHARRPVRCVPLTANRYSLQLTWSKEHALRTPQQWSFAMFSNETRRMPSIGGYHPYGLSSILTGLESHRACVGYAWWTNCSPSTHSHLSTRTLEGIA